MTSPLMTGELMSIIILYTDTKVSHRGILKLVKYILCMHMDDVFVALDAFYEVFLVMSSPPCGETMVHLVRSDRTLHPGRDGQV
jgi:hypothetical protein